MPFKGWCDRGCDQGHHLTRHSEGFAFKDCGVQGSPGPPSVPCDPPKCNGKDCQKGMSAVSMDMSETERPSTQTLVKEAFGDK